MDFGADAGVDPDRADVGAVASVAGNEVDLPDLSVEQRVQIPEKRGVRPEHPAEVVPRTGGKGADRDVRQQGGAADTFIEGSVAAAGIDTERFPGGGLPADFLGGVAGGFGDVELPGIRAMVKGSLHAPKEVPGGVPASGDGVDNEQMFQGLTRLLTIILKCGKKRGLLIVHEEVALDHAVVELAFLVRGPAEAALKLRMRREQIKRPVRKL